MNKEIGAFKINIGFRVIIYNTIQQTQEEQQQLRQSWIILMTRIGLNLP